MTVEMLHSLPLLSDISSAMLDRCMQEQTIWMKSYPKGAPIHDQESVCTALEVVLRGSLAAYALSENGSMTTVFRFEAKDMVGANLLFGDQCAYPLHIHCIANAVLIGIEKQVVFDLLHNQHFTMQYIRGLSLNSQGMKGRIAMQTQRTLRQNILDYLQRQSELQKSDSIVLPVPKKELADLFGVQRPSLFRELKRMENVGMIEVRNRTIELLVGDQETFGV